MAVKTQEQIVQEIIAHIDKTGGEYHLWLVGTTSRDPKTVIFETHKVSRENGKWIYRTMENAQEAQAVVTRLNALGLKSIIVPKSVDEKVVYAFKSTDTTRS